MGDLGKLLEEPPGGANHGHAASALQADSVRRTHPLGDGQVEEFLRDGGWSIARVKDPRPAGMSSHRGVLHPDEYVDPEALQELVEAELGFSYEQMRSVYRQGRLSSEQLELRGRIDSRILDVVQAGASVSLLGRVLGFPVKENGTCRVLENALARARERTT